MNETHATPPDETIGATSDQPGGKGEAFPRSLGDGGRFELMNEFSSKEGRHDVALYKDTASESQYEDGYVAGKRYERDHIPEGRQERDRLLKLKNEYAVTVVPLLASWEEKRGGKPHAFWLFTRWIEGGSLARAPHRDIDFIDRVVPGFLERLAGLHDRSIANNDIAAENLYPTDEDLLISDFDRACHPQEQKPPKSRPWYTPVSPRVTAAEKDAYAAGLVLFEMSTGVRVRELAGDDRTEMPIKVRDAVQQKLPQIAARRHLEAIMCLLGTVGNGGTEQLRMAAAVMRSRAFEPTTFRGPRRWRASLGAALRRLPPPVDTARYLAGALALAGAAYLITSHLA